MKRSSIKAFILASMAMVAFWSCKDESGLYEEIDPDALRVANIFQLKNMSTENCKYKVTLSATVVSGGDNFAAGTCAIEDGTEAQQGILVVADEASKFSFGEKVNIYLDGTTIKKNGGLITMTVPAGQMTSAGASAQAAEAVQITPALLAGGNYQSMYVSLEGWQVVEEDLEKTWGEGIRIETKEKDTVCVHVLSSASFASHKPLSGSGKISGVVSHDGDGYVIMPQAEDDVEFTDPRFIVTAPNRAFHVWAEGASLKAFVSEVSSNEMEGAVQLQGAANCFVVNAPGTYCFDAKAADGNYPAGIEEGSKIYFKVKAVGGNTVVCYVSPEDGTTVLWTWHIWAASASLEEMSITRKAAAADDGVVRSVVMLDRLLGATSTTPGELGTYGLVYQWGRKDAIIGAGIRGSWSSSGDNEIPTGSDKWVENMFDGTAISTANNDLFPDFGYKFGTDLGEATQSHLAGAQFATTYIGNSSSSSIVGYPSYNDTKWAAVANPCPAGYHVPTPDEAKAILGVTASYTGEEYTFHADGTTPGMDKEKDLGTKLKGLDVWFPNCGNRARNSARYLNLGSRHYSWIDEISGNSGKCFSIQSNGTTTTVNPANSFNRGNATSVRCVKDDSYIEGAASDNGAIVWSDASSLTANISKASTVAMSGATALDGPANCYVIKTAGKYSFDAKDAAGNYPAGIPEGTKMYINVTSATPGNAVVGYCDPDTKALLWTWHIWIAGASASEMEVAKNGVTMLDRLLGATSVTPGSVGAIGLYYQWGRKDPLAGVNTTGVGDDTEDMKLDYVDGAKGFPGAATNKGTVNTEVTTAWAGAEFSGKTHQDAAALPTTYLTGYTFADALYPEAVMWDAAADPCPAGYAVPSRDQSAGFFGAGADIFANMYNADGTTAGMDITTNFGCTLSGYGIWFPNNGNRARAEGRAVSLGRRHFSWDNERSGNNGYIIRLARAQGDNNTAATFAKGNATGVRCVKK